MSNVAVITGAAQGIGRRTAQVLNEQGWSLLLLDLQSVGTSEYSSALALAGDISDEQFVESAAKQCVEKFGRVDALVNNAGITQDNLAMRMKDEEWDEVIAVNMTATFKLAKAVQRGMMKRRNGRIINIASVVGVMGNPGQCNYVASKAGMIGWSKAMGQEVASRGITVNCVAPGFIATSMTEVLTDDQKAKISATIPMQKMGSAQDIAAAVTYLASEEAGYVTGATIHVNGGMAMI